MAAITEVVDRLDRNATEMGVTPNWGSLDIESDRYEESNFSGSVYLASTLKFSVIADKEES